MRVWIFPKTLTLPPFGGLFLLMPLLEPSAYTRRPWYMPGMHWETIVPSVFFKEPDPGYERQRLELADGDFLDVDWLRQSSNRCMIISHGLEGSADRFYVKRTARYFYQRGYDIAAWNCRSCSGEMNRLPRFYHHGATEDLAAVVNEVLSRGFEEVVLMGYSMGGSMSLKYAGERLTDGRIKAVITFAVPCSLRDSSETLSQQGNRFYEQRFLKKLIRKITIKAAQHPEISIDGIEQLETFDQFHDRYTAPLHGFSSRNHFFERATCDQYMPEIQIPTLIVNAANDPMLGEKCYPRSMAEASANLFLEIPRRGGHAGFTLSGKPYSYMEWRGDWFLQTVAGMN